MKATLTHALRLAEGLDITPDNYLSRAELIRELRELERHATERTAIVRSITEQTAMRGLIAAIDK